ncbi:hypothetical protein N0V95_002053 [Ascochyta clinopodiicola]|nr:hypothetical protein N0V95_002053 [Ascochyta clinopodiicola]
MLDEEQILAEYGVHENYASVCLDGPKRDRLVWLGDFLHTVRIISASISRMDLAKGTLQFLLDWQISSGLLPYAPPIGYNASVASDAFAMGGGDYLAGYEVASIILPDYQILGILSFTNYVYLTNDIEFARQTWSGWELNIGWVLRQVDPVTGLLSLIGAFLGPADKGSAINCALVEALNGMSEVAYILGDTEAYLKYRSAAADLVVAVNKNLWIERTGIYSMSPNLPEAFSVNSIAFCITSGTANATQAGQLLTKLPLLKLGPGYKDSTLVDGSDPSTNISPNTNGFLLSALLSQPDGAQPSWNLLQTLWPEMLNDEETTTGASWEYVSVHGDPGLGFFTSLSHPWGGAATYLLVEWVVGIQPVKGIDGFGYRNWIINPNMGMRFGLKHAKGRVRTPLGQLEAEWKVTGGVMHVVITAPDTTKGTFQLGQVTRLLNGGKEYRFEVEVPL